MHIDEDFTATSTLLVHSSFSSKQFMQYSNCTVVLTLSMQSNLYMFNFMNCNAIIYSYNVSFIITSNMFSLTILENSLHYTLHLHTQNLLLLHSVFTMLLLELMVLLLLVVVLLQYNAMRLYITQF